MTELKQTPLNAAHHRLGAKMVDFGGWDMPVQYSAGVVEEHLRTRNTAGLFDVSHMGEIEVRGSDAISFVNHICSNDVTKLIDGQAQYTSFTTPEGTVIDDLLVYRFAADYLLLIVNAATTEKDWNWIETNQKWQSIKLRNSSADYCQLAVQGPNALEFLRQLTSTDLTKIKYYHFTTDKVCGVESIISRTGYTGEDGFEIYAAPDKAQFLWDRILDAGNYGAAEGILPCGLAARNTLRLEAAMALYGHEIDETTTLLEAGLGWICKLDKGNFIGRDALLKQKETGIKRKLVGFEMTGRGIARDDQDVHINGEKAGRVTSASPAPFLKKNIGMAYVPVEWAREGQEIGIDVRGTLVAAKITAMPFYKRAR